MPQDLLVDANPSLPQRGVMEAHGFQCEMETADSAFVTWRGHGLAIVLPRARVPSPAALISIVAQRAEQKGISKIRKTLWRLLGMKEIDCPVPFELVEMDVAATNKKTP